MTDASQAAPNAGGPESLGALDQVVDKVSDRFNPILVKELRQSLRGRAFRIAFICVLVLLTFASVGALLSASRFGQAQGREFFVGVYVCLGLALYGLVPFSAFASLGGEWEENTFDLLVLSNLRPRDVVRGKIMSAGVQALLYMATFGPFLACAFLMQGVDLGAMLAVLGISFLWSLALSMVAIALSTLARQRFLRIGMMVALAGALATGFGMAMGGAQELLREPELLRDTDFREGGVGFLLLGAFVTTLLFQIACNQLAHPEENRSTGLRVTTTAALLAGLAWTSYMLFQHPSGDALSAIYIMMLFMGVAVPSTLFVSEPNPLGRRVGSEVARSGFWSRFTAPWLPGGGRGVGFYLLHLAVLMGTYPLVHLMTMKGTTYPIGDNGMFGFYGMCLYATGYVLLPGGLLSGNLGKLPVRIAARILVPFLALVLFVLPALLAFLLGIGDLDSFRHPGNPGYFVDQNWRGVGWPAAWVVALVFAGSALALNLPRLFRGIQEVAAVQSKAEAKTEDNRVA